MSAAPQLQILARHLAAIAQRSPAAEVVIVDKKDRAKLKQELRDSELSLENLNAESQSAKTPSAKEEAAKWIRREVMRRKCIRDELELSSVGLSGTTPACLQDLERIALQAEPLLRELGAVIPDGEPDAGQRLLLWAATSEPATVEREGRRNFAEVRGNPFAVLAERIEMFAAGSVRSKAVSESPSVSALAEKVKAIREREAEAARHKEQQAKLDNIGWSAVGGFSSAVVRLGFTLAEPHGRAINSEVADATERLRSAVATLRGIPKFVERFGRIDHEKTFEGFQNRGAIGTDLDRTLFLCAGHIIAAGLADKPNWEQEVSKISTERHFWLWLNFLLKVIVGMQEASWQEEGQTKGGGTLSPATEQATTTEAPATPTPTPPGVEQGEGTAGSANQTHPPADEWIWAPEGNGYRVAGLGDRGFFTGLKGLAMIEKLVRSPGQPVPMVVLVGDATEKPDNDKRSKQPAMDMHALRETHKRVEVLRAEVEQAESEGRTLEAAESRNELERLDKTLKAAVGIQGKVRDLNDLAKKLRPTIHAALARVYKAMREPNPPLSELANHLEWAISSEGAAFVYRPALAPPPSWKISLADRM